MSKLISERRNANRQRGSVAVMTAAMIVGLVGISALAVDYTRLAIAQNEIQNEADGLSLVGAGYLYGQPGNNNNSAPQLQLSTARGMACDQQAENGIKFKTQPTADTCKATSGLWTSLDPGSAPAGSPNYAVKVTISRTVQTTFAQIFFIQSNTITATATAMVPPPVQGSGGSGGSGGNGNGGGGRGGNGGGSGNGGGGGRGGNGG